LAAELLFNICIVCDRGLLFQTIQWPWVELSEIRTVFQAWLTEWASLHRYNYAEMSPYMSL
jgi:hypothetical protein